MAKRVLIFTARRRQLAKRPLSQLNPLRVLKNNMKNY